MRVTTEARKEHQGIGPLGGELTSNCTRVLRVKLRSSEKSLSCEPFRECSQTGLLWVHHRNRKRRVVGKEKKQIRGVQCCCFFQVSVAQPWGMPPNTQRIKVIRGRQFHIRYQGYLEVTSQHHQGPWSCLVGQFLELGCSWFCCVVLAGMTRTTQLHMLLAQPQPSSLFSKQRYQGHGEPQICSGLFD